MNTYIYNRVICCNKSAEEMFIDHIPPCGGFPAEKVVSFKKIYGKPDWYNKERIFSGYGSLIKKNHDRTDMRFCTLEKVPINTIIAAIKMASDIRWYACDDNFRRVYRYHYDGETIWADTLDVDEGAFIEWIRDKTEYGDKELEIEDCDCALWYFVDGRSKMWKRVVWDGYFA